MNKRDETIAGLDIGTTKTCVIVGQRTEDGIDIIGVGSHPSRGLRKGVIINIESTVDSIKKAVEEAELMAGCEINEVYTGISGGHIRGVNSHGIVAIKNKEVSSGDVERVIDAAQAVAIPLDREVIHVIPQEYRIDDQDSIKDPVGMCGVRLEAKVHIISAAATAAQNIVKCANRAGLAVSDIFLEQIASSMAALSQEEKDLGGVLIDTGGGTTDVAIFTAGSLVHTAVIPIGGSHITNDIAVGLRTPTAEAEKIKLKYGCALSSLVQKEETIQVPSVGGRADRLLSRQILAEIIEPRVEEIFSIVRQEIINSGFSDLVASGIVLTGGSSLLEGAVELAEQVFDLPVRRGLPESIGGLAEVVKSPVYSTAVGLLLQAISGNERKGLNMKGDSMYQRAKGRMREWLSEIL